ncbi:lanC-like protein 3 [Rhopilema esculentum]|uniref:lanC-like protein 3 n=1 Tax=Rhopilema esculentum TaxID=499914 RepID=UPI0031D3FAC4
MVADKIACQSCTLYREMQHPRYFENTLDDSKPSQDISDAQKDYVPELLQIIHKNCPPLPENCDGGMYVGAAGIAYAFYHVAESPTFSEKRSNFLDIAEAYIKVAIKEINKVDPLRGGIGTSLLLGHAGIYVTAALIYEAQGYQAEKSEYLQNFLSIHSNLPVNFFAHGCDEFFIGRAGYLAACLMLNRRFQKIAIPNEVTLQLCNLIIESGRQYSKKVNHPSPLMYAYYNCEYIGAGHGIAAILLALLNFPECYMNNPVVEADIKASIDYVLSHEQRNGNYPPVPDECRDDWNELVHWCHGASGVVYLLAKAFIVWKDERYLAAALRCGELVWSRGLLKKGPGLCHGIAGNGYVFLLLHRLTSDEKYLHRARQFAAFMQTEEFKGNSRVPDAPYSLYEGIAGTACFLADLVNPADATYPFMEVF